MRESDRMLLIELVDGVRKLTATVEELRESQRRTEERLEKTEKMLEHSRKLTQAHTRTVYAQVEDLMALYRDIEPAESLPRMRGWAASPELLRYVYEETVAYERSSALECGSGTTTVVLAYAMQALGEGKVTALEHDRHYAELTRRELFDRGLEDWAEVREAELTDVDIDGKAWRWYDPAAIPDGEIDLLVVDGPPGATGPEARYPAMPMLADRLTPEALVVLDDADRPDERTIVARWKEAFPNFDLERLKHERGTVVLRGIPKL